MKDRTTIQLSESLRKELRQLAARRDVSYQQLLSDMVLVFKELERDKTILSVPSILADKVRSIISDTSFKTLSDYVAFLLRLVLYENVKLDTQKDMERLKKKLKALGYLA